MATQLLTVRAVLITKTWQLRTVEKTFKTEAARDKWLDRKGEEGVLHEVQAYC